MKTMVTVLAAGALAVSRASAASDGGFTPAASTSGFAETPTLSDGVAPLSGGVNMAIVSRAAGADANVTALPLPRDLSDPYGAVSLPSNIDLAAPTPPGATAARLEIRRLALLQRALAIVCGLDDTEATCPLGPPRSITFRSVRSSSRRPRTASCRARLPSLAVRRSPSPTLAWSATPPVRADTRTRGS